MATDGRTSISASTLTSSSGRRTSNSSFQPPPLPPLISTRRASGSSFQLPPLPLSTESLTAGTSIPAPVFSPPTPPPKDSTPAQMSLPVPLTPQRKPVLRQKSPLSNEAYFSSPALSIPGAFPTSPPPVNASPNTGLQNAQFRTTAYAAGDLSSPNSKSPKRPGSIRNLLSFRALRKSYDNTSSDAAGYRPASPGGESTLSSGRPTLNKKKSGSFWRRTSSLGMNFGSEGDKGNQTPSSGIKSDSMVEGEASIRSPTPASNDDFPTVKKRKSGTFWRRRSSMGLDTAFGPNGGSGVGTIDTTNGAMNGNRHGDHNDLNRDHKEVAITEQENEKQLPQIPLSPVTNYEEEMLPQRSYSPPPQLPDFIGAGGGLGGEDLFKDIH